MDSMPPRVAAVGVGRFAAGSVPVTPVASGIDGRSPATSAHGANDVADPQVPITRWEAWPVAAPTVRVEPDSVQVNQFAPVAEQELAPPGDEITVCARTLWENQPAKARHKRNGAMRVEACLDCMKILLSHDGRCIVSILLYETAVSIIR
jgi:hypothetical protein